MMTRIVVIEDEEDLRTVLTFNLQNAGYTVLATGTGTEGIQLIREHLPDMVLLDLILPDLSGVEVCKQLKQQATTQNIPVMMLTARGEEDDRVSGFEAGAEDYLVKPFSLRELLLRIGVILTRNKKQGESKESFGLLHMDRDAHRIWIGQKECVLTALEFRLLLQLFDNRHRVQSRGELLREVWGWEGEAVTRTVDTHIKRLREKLGPAGIYVETVRGIGYRFAKSPE